MEKFLETTAGICEISTQRKEQSAQEYVLQKSIDVAQWNKRHPHPHP